MFAASIPLLVALLIIFADVSIVNGGPEEEACAKQASYTVLSNAKVQSLTINLYYDASKDLDEDMGFISSMCEARASYPTQTYNFFVGATVKKGKDGIMCPHVDPKNKDCTDNINQACASKIISDKFPDFVCCTSGGKSAGECLDELDKTKRAKFDECVQWTHPTIKPDQVLLNNVQAAKNADPEAKYFPVLTFNGQKADPCARYMFFHEPLTVVCNMVVKCEK